MQPTTGPRQSVVRPRRGCQAGPLPRGDGFHEPSRRKGPESRVREIPGKSSGNRSATRTTPARSHRRGCRTWPAAKVPKGPRKPGCPSCASTSRRPCVARSIHERKR
ncbi:MAG: hypothetical protein EBT22_14030 [Chloroflexi bacterium]|nr:hypothetical protein [Chloroflexota bacterium]